MSKKTLLAIVGLLVVSAFCLAGCGKKDVTEEWGYAHDQSTPVLSFYKEGNAKYHDKDYKSYEITDKVIRLTDDKGNVTEIKYNDEKEKRYIYESKTYEYSYGDDSSQLPGVWENKDSASFQFTVKGTFLEDGIFPGHYYVNEEEHSIRLAYNDPMPDIYLYYSIDNGILTIEYPWPLLKCDR